jgi:hypothetical protein
LSRKDLVAALSPAQHTPRIFSWFQGVPEGREKPLHSLKGKEWRTEANHESRALRTKAGGPYATPFRASAWK